MTRPTRLTRKTKMCSPRLNRNKPGHCAQIAHLRQMVGPLKASPVATSKTNKAYGSLSAHGQGRLLPNRLDTRQGLGAPSASFSDFFFFFSPAKYLSFPQFLQSLATPNKVQPVPNKICWPASPHPPTIIWETLAARMGRCLVYGSFLYFSVTEYGDETPSPWSFPSVGIVGERSPIIRRHTWTRM